MRVEVYPALVLGIVEADVVRAWDPVFWRSLTAATARQEAKSRNEQARKRREVEAKVEARRAAAIKEMTRAARAGVKARGGKRRPLPFGPLHGPSTAGSYGRRLTITGSDTTSPTEPDIKASWREAFSRASREQRIL